MSRSKISVVLLCAGLGAALSVPALAQKPIAYPAKGQSQAQQQQDDGYCYSWAKSNTGIDLSLIHI